MPLQITFPLTLAHLMHERYTRCTMCKGVIAERTERTIHLMNLKNISIQPDTGTLQAGCVHCRRVYTIPITPQA